MMKKEKQAEAEVIVNRFINNLDSLKSFTKNLTPVVVGHDKAIIDRRKRSIDKIMNIIGVTKEGISNKNNGKVRVKLTNNQLHQILSTLKAGPATPPVNSDLLYTNSFVALTSYFEFLLSDLLHFYFKKFPDCLESKEVKITLKDLKLFKNIEEYLDFTINKEIEKTMYSSFQDQLSYFQETLNVKFDNFNPDIDLISEATQRRNIIVHNNGIVNKRYLDNVAKKYIPKEFKEGTKIKIKEDYFMRVLVEIFILGIELSHACWRKWEKDQSDKADSHLIHITYTCLKNEEWEVAERIGRFSQGLTVKEERSRIYLKYNYWLALKLQKKIKELESKLKDFDCSGLAPLYLLGLSCLKSDKLEFYRLLKPVIVTERLRKEDFLEWPLFYERRLDKEFKNKLSNAFRLSK